MCLVEMGMPAVDPATKAPVMDPATGKQKINWMPRPDDRLRDQRLARACTSARRPRWSRSAARA
jgi:hypothetical protein